MKVLNAIGNFFKSILSGLWKSLESKGKYTTVLGLAIIVTSVLDPLINHNQGITFEEGYLWQVIWFILAGVILIILPSEITIKSGKGLEIIIKD